MFVSLYIKSAKLLMKFGNQTHFLTVCCRQKLVIYNFKYYYCLQDRDGTTRVSEALIKIFVAQICKDLPQETAKLLVNPNEVCMHNLPMF